MAVVTTVMAMVGATAIMPAHRLGIGVIAPCIMVVATTMAGGARITDDIAAATARASEAVEIGTRVVDVVVAEATIASRTGITMVTDIIRTMVATTTTRIKVVGVKAVDGTTVANCVIA